MATQKFKVPVEIADVEIKKENATENITNTNTIEEDTEHEMIQSMIKFFKSLLFMGADDIDVKGGKLSLFPISSNVNPPGLFPLGYSRTFFEDS